MGVLLVDDDRDNRSTVAASQAGSTISTASKLSEAKLQALDAARAHAIHSRRVKAKARLEQRLDELRRLCSGLSDDHLARVAAHLVKLEEQGRERQNKLTETLNKNTRAIYEQTKATHDLLRSVKTMLEAPSRHAHSSSSHR